MEKEYWVHEFSGRSLENAEKILGLKLPLRETELIVVSVVKAKSVNVIALDASQLIFPDENNRMTSIDWLRSQRALEDFLKNQHFDHLVITGNIASATEGNSEYLATILAKLFKAKGITIWTEHDGIYTADPDRVRSAFVIESLSYQEALELAYFGAKILNPMTIAPALECQIPIYIKNSFHPEAKGTCISASPRHSSYLIRGLSGIDNIALINIEGTGMAGVSGTAARVFEIMHQEKISVILISQASSEHSICFAVANTVADRAVKALRVQLQFELDHHLLDGVFVEKDRAILSAVGDEMIGNIGISSKLCGSLAKANINILAISQGSSERNISVVIHQGDLNRGLQSVHAGFYLSPKTISIGLIGPGLVGSAVLNQIQNASEQLKATSEVNLFVRGIMNSKKMLVSHEPIDLSSWKAELESSELTADINQFIEHIRADDVPHAVIIDCTASGIIASRYVDFMKKGIHIITPNKQANSGNYQYYQTLKNMTHKRNNYYLYEATVCAGLPVINTLQDLLKTGDEVEKIEGVVSGTLSYIFNELAKGRAFSEIVTQAKALGYTEPDPRDDLSGMDVARKLTCLAREMGHAVMLDDVRVHNLVPPDLMHCSVEDFLLKLPSFDNDMKVAAMKAAENKEKLCYAGIIHQDGRIEVAIKTFPDSHPFSRLQGTENMIIFHTRRYHDYPLVIQGPGAGAEVTAAGIFADLLRLGSYLS